MKYFTAITAETLDSLWYGQPTISLHKGSNTLIYVQCNKQGNPRIDGKASFYSPLELEKKDFDYKVVPLNINEFDNLLNKLSLTRREFAEMIGITYESMNVMLSKENPPKWVTSALIVARKLKESEI